LWQEWREKLRGEPGKGSTRAWRQYDGAVHLRFWPATIRHRTRCDGGRDSSLLVHHWCPKCAKHSAGRYFTVIDKAGYGRILPHTRTCPVWQFAPGSFYAVLLIKGRKSISTSAPLFGLTPSIGLIRIKTSNYRSSIPRGGPLE
jgi:hypothetical protein